MRVISCHLQNFGSYKELDFDFQNQGLTLISGATGSGKSTLCDAIPWVLFGRSAKNGAVDEIRSWGVTDNTKGILTVETVTGKLHVIRLRGKVNDLCYCVGEETSIEWTRGKDLNDTQKQINSLLGLDCELYLSGAYFHEFSQTAQFFTSTAKIRRQICEQIVDLSLAKKLQLNTTAKYKELSNKLHAAVGQQNTLKYNVKTLEGIQEAESAKADRWAVQHEKTLSYMKRNYDRFEESRDYTIIGKCTECGTQLKEDKHCRNNEENPYKEQLERLSSETNPHTGATKDYTHAIAKQKQEILELEETRASTAETLADLDVLVDVVDAFRGALIEDTIAYVESEMNKLLTEHFDAELRASLVVEGADKLEVSLYKDGNLATYTQLSKGQRQLLKLCFSVAVMSAVENRHGVTFPQLFLDEAMDGLDENFKTKAYKLLDCLAATHESVFVVEHSEGLKSMFPNTYNVTLVNGNSEICQN